MSTTWSFEIVVFANAGQLFTHGFTLAVNWFLTFPLGVKWATQ